MDQSAKDFGHLQMSTRFLAADSKTDCQRVLLHLTFTFFVVYHEMHSQLTVLRALFFFFLPVIISHESRVYYIASVDD